MKISMSGVAHAQNKSVVASFQVIWKYDAGGAAYRPNISLLRVKSIG